MTLSGSVDATHLLSIVGSGELLVRYRWSGFLAFKVCEVRRRRIMNMETMSSVVVVDAESS